MHKYLKSAIALTFFIFGLAALLLAEGQGELRLHSHMRPGTRGVLQSFPATGVKFNQVSCGTYFLFAPMGEKNGTILFMFDHVERTGEVVPEVPSYGTDKIGYRIVEETKVPEVKMLHDGGPILPWVEITLSSEELARSPCLEKYTKKVE